MPSTPPPPGPTPKRKKHQLCNTLKTPPPASVTESSVSKSPASASPDPAPSDRTGRLPTKTYIYGTVTRSVYTTDVGLCVYGSGCGAGRIERISKEDDTRKGEIWGVGGEQCCSSPRSRVIRLIERVDTFVDQACWVESGLSALYSLSQKKKKEERGREKERHRKPTTHQDHPWTRPAPSTNRPPPRHPRS